MTAQSLATKWNQEGATSDKHGNRVVVSDFFGPLLPLDFYDNLTGIVFLGTHPPRGILYECEKRCIQLLILPSKDLPEKRLRQFMLSVDANSYTTFKGQDACEIGQSEDPEAWSVASFQLQYPTTSTGRDIFLDLSKQMSIQQLMDLPYWNDVGYLSLQCTMEELDMIGICSVDISECWAKCFQMRCVHI